MEQILVVYTSNWLSILFTSSIYLNGQFRIFFLNCTILNNSDKYLHTTDRQKHKFS